MFAAAAIVDCRLSFADQRKQTSVFFSVCSKHREVCCFCFPFVAKERKLPFIVSSIFWKHGDIETLRHWDVEMEKWKHGDMDMRHRNLEKMETWRHGHGNMDMEIWTWRPGHRDIDMETWTRIHWYGGMDKETWTWRHGHGDIDIKAWTWRHEIKILNGKRKPVKRLLIVQTEVCPLSVCWQRNKWKLSVCQRTNFYAKRKGEILSS